MSFVEYERAAGETANYPTDTYAVSRSYVVLGINGEAGEVAEKWKKILRDSDGYLAMDQQLAIKKELGDVLWYLSRCCYEFGLTLDEVAEANIEKLRSRKERGVIGGSGDDR